METGLNSPIYKLEVYFIINVNVNSGNSPQMVALRRSRGMDQSTQHFHVGCDNQYLLGNEYGGLHGREFLGRTLIFTG